MYLPILSFFFSSHPEGVLNSAIIGSSDLDPCQDIVAILQSSSPAVNADGQIRVCVGESVTLNGSATFSDNGPWTTDTLFTGLSEGIHEIWARDIIGCGQTRVELLVIGYPPFFTPNGDGYNDTWNIFSLSDQLESKIYIFER